MKLLIVLIALSIIWSPSSARREPRDLLFGTSSLNETNHARGQSPILVDYGILMVNSTTRDKETKFRGFEPSLNSSVSSLETPSQFGVLGGLFRSKRALLFLVNDAPLNQSRFDVETNKTMDEEIDGLEVIDPPTIPSGWTRQRIPPNSSIDSDDETLDIQLWLVGKDVEQDESQDTSNESKSSLESNERRGSNSSFSTPSLRFRRFSVLDELFRSSSQPANRTSDLAKSVSNSSSASPAYSPPLVASAQNQSQETDADEDTRTTFNNEPSVDEFDESFNVREVPSGLSTFSLPLPIWAVRMFNWTLSNSTGHKMSKRDVNSTEPSNSTLPSRPGKRPSGVNVLSVMEGTAIAPISNVNAAPAVIVNVIIARSGLNATNSSSVSSNSSVPLRPVRLQHPYVIYRPAPVGTPHVHRPTVTSARPVQRPLVPYAPTSYGQRGPLNSGHY